MGPAGGSAASPQVTYVRVRTVADRRLALLTARIRILFVALGFAVLALIAGLRIVFYGLAGGHSGPMTLEQALLPMRGEITDRNGMALARNYPSRALWFDPTAMAEDGAPLVRPVDAIVADLKAIFPDLDGGAVARKLRAGEPAYLRRSVLPEEASRVHDLGEPALQLPEEPDRYYPQGTLAAHILGYVGSDGEGHVGMEQVLQDRLSNPVTRGQPIALSVDLHVQGALEDELRSGMLATNAKGAGGVVLDVESGEVLALASLPDFDPNRVRTADVRVSPEEARRGEVPNIYNKITNQAYELGSTFKPITLASALDAGTVRGFAHVYDATPVKIAGRTINDSHHYGSALNVAQAMVHSSNTVTARIADELGADRLRRTLMDLGMNERPYIELPARGMPIWPGDHWSRIKTMTVSYGHGVAVTPLHLAAAYAALVNGGIWRPATLMKVAPGKEARGRRVFKQSTSSRMRQILRLIALYGTGRNADAPGYRVGGKTGSAEKPGVGGYRHSSVVSTFAAAFPMDHPRYVIVVMLDEPKGTTASSFQRTAAWNAAPIVGALVPRIGPILGVRPDDSRDVDISDLRPLVRGGGE